MVEVGIYGASGYTGQELLRLLAGHPEVRVVAATSRRFAGKAVADVYPVLAGLTDLVYEDAAPEEIASRAELVFLALPHGVSMKFVPRFLAAGCKVVDLSADFRLRDEGVYGAWYGHHEAAVLLEEAVYGLPELYRERIRTARLVANPGCYPTSIILGLAPLLRAGWIDPATVIVDAKSGVSGAGREPVIGSLFCEVDGSFKAYKAGGVHRHIPEIEQELSTLAGTKTTITFTPHLLPVKRGILSTIYAGLSRRASTQDLLSLYAEFYAGEPFVRVLKAGQAPTLSAVAGSNYCDIGALVEERTGRVIILSAIDNLVKGASGQAIQNMNLMSGLAEGAGLPRVALFP